MGRINLDIGAAGIFILVENLAERLASVGGGKDPALFVRPVGVTGDCDKEAIRVLRIHCDLRDLLCVPKSKMGPGCAGIPGFVNAVANREIRSMQSFAAPDVNDFWVGD